MLQPKRTKFRKMQKGRNRGVVVNALLNFGVFGLKSMNYGRLSSAQIESARRVLSRATKRQGRIWIRVFPDKPITEKPLEVRMGKGKGNIERWVALVQPGRLLYEMDGVSEDLARHAFKLADSKLPVKTIFVVKKDIYL